MEFEEFAAVLMNRVAPHVTGTCVFGRAGPDHHVYGSDGNLTVLPHEAAALLAALSAVNVAAAHSSSDDEGDACSNGSIAAPILTIGGTRYHVGFQVPGELHLVRATSGAADDEKSEPAGGAYVKACGGVIVIGTYAGPRSGAEATRANHAVMECGAILAFENV
jgi:hypothetical protein